MEKNCQNCACKKVCNHTQFNVENCHNWIYQQILDESPKNYYEAFEKALQKGYETDDFDEMNNISKEAVDRFYAMMSGVVYGRPTTDMVFASAALVAFTQLINMSVPEDLYGVQRMLVESVITFRLNNDALQDSEDLSDEAE